MAKVLILFAHPGQRHSRINVAAASEIAKIEGITFADLYASYPRYDIDIDREQEALRTHDAILLQFPIYWYSTPSLLKEWMDLVLEFGFAYGPGGTALKDKILLPIVTAGGAQEAYQPTGRNNFTLRALLAPLEQTAMLCQMRYVPPFALFSAHGAATDPRGPDHRARYRALVEALRDDRFDIDAATARDLLSDGDIPTKGAA